MHFFYLSIVTMALRNPCRRERVENRDGQHRSGDFI
jgi:hypothetical protein